MKTIQITNAMPRMWGIGAGKKHPALRLKPGVTQVPVEAWTEIKKNPTVEKMLKDGDLEEGEAADVDAGTLPSKPSAAISLIKKTLDLQVLREWAKSDRPANVKTALETQIKLIESRAATDKNKTGEGSEG